MGLFDVHAHLTHPRLLPKVDDVLARAQAAGVTTIISNGLNPTDNQRVRELAARSPLVRPAFGLYPVDAVLPEMMAAGIDYPRDDDPVPAEEAIEWVAAHVGEAIAVGEIGLDGYWVPGELWDRPGSRVQEARRGRPGRRQAHHHPHPQARGALLRGAAGDGRHTRELALLRRPREARPPHRGARPLPLDSRQRPQERSVHPHAGDVAARPRVARDGLPLPRPQPREDNEPATVRGTAEYAAELWGEPLEGVQAQLAENFERLFGSPP